MDYPNETNSPDKDLDGEPSVADALNVEESVVGIGAVLVQGPVGGVPPGRHSDVPGATKLVKGDFREFSMFLPYHRDPHIRVGFEAEGQDGNADKKDRDDTNNLKS